MDTNDEFKDKECNTYLETSLIRSAERKDKIVKSQVLKDNTLLNKKNKSSKITFNLFNQTSPDQNRSGQA